MPLTHTNIAHNKADSITQNNLTTTYNSTSSCRESATTDLTSQAIHTNTHIQALSQDSITDIQADSTMLHHQENREHISTQDSVIEATHFHAPTKINPDFITHCKKSCIILTNNFDTEKNLLKNTYNTEQLRIFELEELKIDDAHEVIKEAHIATAQDKIIAIFANSYNNFAQNALLKILEEPPSHILFMLYVNAKNKLLPTIFSRLVSFDKRKKVVLEPFPLDITRLNIPMVYEYIKTIESQNLSSEDGRMLLTRLLNAIAKHNIQLSQSELERFDRSLQCLNTKQSVHFVLLPLLLSLIKR